jgi:hypothetical protein
LDKNSDVQEQGTVDVGLNDAPIIQDEIKADAGFNNQLSTITKAITV